MSRLRVSFGVVRFALRILDRQLPPDRDCRRDEVVEVLALGAVVDDADAEAEVAGKDGGGRNGDAAFLDAKQELGVESVQLVRGNA